MRVESFWGFVELPMCQLLSLPWVRRGKGDSTYHELYKFNCFWWHFSEFCFHDGVHGVEEGSNYSSGEVVRFGFLAIILA